MANVHANLAGRLAQDRDKGLLPMTLDPETTASVIITDVHGLWRMALVEHDRRRQIAAFLIGLGL